MKRFVMRPLVSVKWKIIIAVVGVNCLSLLALALLNRRQADQYTLADSRDLIREMAYIEAANYAMAMDNVDTMTRALSSRIHAELEFAADQSSGVREVHNSLEQISKTANDVITISRETAQVAESVFRKAADLRGLTHRDARSGQSAGEDDGLAGPAADGLLPSPAFRRVGDA